MKIDGKTRVCAVIGNPVEHSLSPALHNEAFRHKGLNICYTAFRVDDLAGALAGMRALNLLGLSVTIPHKVAVLSHLDEVDETAQRIGSVNTVLNRDNKLIGYNSDGMGALRALQDAGIELKGKRVTVLGSGGAARAIAFALAKEVAFKKMLLLGIDTKECSALCDDLRQVVSFPVTKAQLSRETLERHIPESDGVIHCTPVGMSPRNRESLLNRNDLNPEQFVFDIVYTPLKTRLLQEAEAAGCRVIPGVEMFIYQAVFQFELWTGRKAPVDCMRKVVMEALK